MTYKKSKITKSDYHRFVDETGDLTFYGDERKVIIGNKGVSKTFSIGMVYIKEDLDGVRDKINNLIKEIEGYEYVKNIPSVKKRIDNKGFYFHAKDDVPEVRSKFFDLLKEIDFSLEIYVARKRSDIFSRKHHNEENEFYADILSHLLKNKFDKYSRLVLNIAQRGSATSEVNLEIARDKAFDMSTLEKGKKCKIVFNVQDFKREPLLSITDYASWAVQRVFEMGDVRHYEFIKEKISLVADIYDYNKYKGSKNYYTKDNPLTKENKITVDENKK